VGRASSGLRKARKVGWSSGLPDESWRECGVRCRGDAPRCKSSMSTLVRATAEH
jgi:hypothetical protein